MAVPVEVVREQGIFTTHKQLVSKRLELEDLVNRIIAGKVSDKSLVEALVVKLKVIISELIIKLEYAIIPKDIFPDYVAGIATLDDYGSEEVLSYYNELQKMYMALNAFIVAVFGIKNIQPRVIVPEFQDNATLDIINLGEFDGSGDIPTSTLEPGYSLYEVLGNDTLQIIAEKEYGDYSKWTEIAKANNITDTDLSDGSYVGKKIKIPLPQTTLSQNKFNMVFEQQVSTLSQESIEKYFYGTDILIENGEIMLKGSDLATVSGKDTVQQNLENRLNGPTAGLNPLVPEWGLGKPKFKQGVPYLVAIDRYLSAIESQVSSDPRVVYATIDRGKVKIEGDALRARVEIQLIGGEAIGIDKDIQ